MSLAGNGPARLRCRGLGVAFGGGPSVFSGFDLDVAPGEAIALYAPAGAGKSALAEALFGLRSPTTGYVEFDGVDPRDVRPAEYRGHVALAAGPEFLDGTIVENVSLDRPHVDTAEVREALRAVGLLDAVLALPDGLKTRLTPDAAPLSSGQAARLMLARAVAGRPRLLIVDGLLDALDDEALDGLLPAIVNPAQTAIVLTARRSVARRFGRSVPLAASPASPPVLGPPRFSSAAEDRP